MTDAEKVELLRGAIARAERILDWILTDEKYPEYVRTTAMRVRRILDAAMEKIKGEPVKTAAPADELPNVKIDVKAMMASGTLTEGKKR